MTRYLTGAALALWAFSARADEPKLLAVLPFAVSERVEAVAREAIEETIRTAAGSALTPHGYVVLTGDNTLRLLADNGIDPEKACDAGCALETAREMKASLFISGSISRLEGEYLVFVRMYDGASGAQLSATRLQSEKVLGVAAEFERQSPQLFGRLLAQSAKKADPPSMTEFDEESRPSEMPPEALKVRFSPETTAQKWLLLGARGEVVCRLPCTRWVPPQSGYRLKFEADNASDIVNLELPPDLGYTPGNVIRATPLAGRSGIKPALWTLLGTSVLGGIIGGVAGSPEAYTPVFIAAGFFSGAIMGLLPSFVVGVVSHRSPRLLIGLAE